MNVHRNDNPAVGTANTYPSTKQKSHGHIDSKLLFNNLTASTNLLSET